MRTATKETEDRGSTSDYGDRSLQMRSFAQQAIAQKILLGQ